MKKVLQEQINAIERYLHSNSQGWVLLNKDASKRYACTRKKKILCFAQIFFTLQSLRPLPDILENQTTSKNEQID